MSSLLTFFFPLISSSGFLTCATVSSYIGLFKVSLLLASSTGNSFAHNCQVSLLQVWFSASKSAISLTAFKIKPKLPKLIIKTLHNQSPVYIPSLISH